MCINSFFLCVTNHYYSRDWFGTNLYFELFHTILSGFKKRKKKKKGLTFKWVLWIPMGCVPSLPKPTHHKAQYWLGHWRNGVMRRAHLGQNLIQPLQRAMQVYLNPARGACDILSMVLCPPTLQNTADQSKIRWEKHTLYGTESFNVFSVGNIYWE